MQELESCHADVHVVKTLHSQLHTHSISNVVVALFQIGAAAQ